MAVSKLHKLAPGYTSEVDNVDEKSWCQLLELFDDANIFKTWSYAEVTRGARNMSHLVLKKNGEVVALAQVRIAKVPLLKIGIAYVRWGPIWQRVNAPHDAEVFLSGNSCIAKRIRFQTGPGTKTAPCCFRKPNFRSRRTLFGGRFCFFGSGNAQQNHTDGSQPHARRNPRRHETALEARTESRAKTEPGNTGRRKRRAVRILHRNLQRNGVAQTIQGTQRHKSIQNNSISIARKKMKIILCKSGQEVSSGLIASTMGNTCVYMFGATSNAGMKSRGSYMLQWKNLESLKQSGCPVYNLNGINPGTRHLQIQERSGLHARQRCFLYRRIRFLRQRAEPFLR